MAAIMLRTMSEAVKKGSGDAPPHALRRCPWPCTEATATLEAKYSMRTPRQRPRRLQRQLQRPLPLTAAAEAAAFDCTEEWGGDAGVDSGGGASVDPYRAAGNDGTASTSPWAAAQGDGSDGEEAELQRPPGSDPGAASARAPDSPTWLDRGCGRDDTQFGDPVTLQCQHHAGRQAGCCWHIACLRTAEERAVTRRVLVLPHSQCALPAVPAWSPSRRPRHGPPRRRRRRL